MRELVNMWQNTRMMVLTAISAAIYVAVLLPFKGFVVIPGLTEVRPGAAVPVVLSFLFGPAAAWGAAFGNTIADVLGGMLSPATLFGFIGNLVYAYLPFTMWRAFFGNQNPVKAGTKGWTFFFLILITSSLAIGTIIGWGADLLKLAPFAALGLIIAVNNLIATLALSAILIRSLYDRVERMGLLYFQILGDESTEAPPDGISALKTNAGHRLARLGALLCLIGAALAFTSGLVISGESLGVGYGAAGFASQARGSLAVAGGMAPGLLVLLLGLILL